MSFRTTKGIVSNFDGSDPKKEADVIMTAAALGFAASYIAKERPIQFDRDPLDVEQQDVTAFNARAETRCVTIWMPTAARKRLLAPSYWMRSHCTAVRRTGLTEPCDDGD